ncbi:hypothetical protein ACFPM0_08865 [Pseudonocardia sulfidoxydans]
MRRADRCPVGAGTDGTWQWVEQDDGRVATLLPGRRSARWRRTPRPRW